MSKSLSELLGWLLDKSTVAQTQPVESIRDWKNRYDENAANWADPVDRAISSGFLADRTGYAFLAGFFAALHRMMPDLPKDKITAFCISEEGGAHPRSIQTTLERNESGKGEWFLTGSKKFITCAPEAESILVAASTGLGKDGRNRIRLAYIDRNSNGVNVEAMPDLPFIPEIRHGVVQFDKVVVADYQLMPGDAYDRYIKPFRTIEDIHVSAAILGFLFRCAAIYNWPKSIREDLILIISAIRPIALAHPSAKQIHIALAGLQRRMDTIINDLDVLWEKAPEAERAAWQRDRAVLGIAGKARALRLETAWQGYGQTT